MESRIMWMILITAIVFLWHGSLTSADERCRDRLKEDHPIILRSKAGEFLARLTNCSTLKQNFPHVCLEPLGIEKCCRTCRKIDTGCLDSPSAHFALVTENGRENLNCANYIRYNKCNCKVVIPGNPAIVVKNECCASCKHVDTSDCNCQDELKAGYSFTLGNGVHIDSCETVKNEYPELCRELGRKRGVCCKSCSGVSTDCLDTRLRQWDYNGTKMECPAYIAADRCHCKHFGVRRDCCASCAGFDQKECCFNSPDFMVTIRFASLRDRCIDCSCNDLLDKGNDFMARACKRHYIRRYCCEACSSEDVKRLMAMDNEVVEP